MATKTEILRPARLCVGAYLVMYRTEYFALLARTARSAATAVADWAKEAGFASAASMLVWGPDGAMFTGTHVGGRHLEIDNGTPADQRPAQYTIHIEGLPSDVGWGESPQVAAASVLVEHAREDGPRSFVLRFDGGPHKPVRELEPLRVAVLPHVGSR